MRDKEGLHFGDFLLSFPIADPITQRLRRVFARTNHWGKVEAYMSDSEWGSDLRISHSEDGQVVAVTFRYAPGMDPIEKLAEFVAIAKDAGCFLLIGSSDVILPPDFDEVFRELRQHHAFRFLSDPEGAIIEGAKKINQKS